MQIDVEEEARRRAEGDRDGVNADAKAKGDRSCWGAEEEEEG